MSVEVLFWAVVVIVAASLIAAGVACGYEIGMRHLRRDVALAEQAGRLAAVRAIRAERLRADLAHTVRCAS